MANDLKERLEGAVARLARVRQRAVSVRRAGEDAANELLAARGRDVIAALQLDVAELNHEMERLRALDPFSAKIEDLRARLDAAIEEVGRHANLIIQGLRETAAPANADLLAAKKELNALIPDLENVERAFAELESITGTEAEPRTLFWATNIERALHSVSATPAALAAHEASIHEARATIEAEHRRRLADLDREREAATRAAESRTDNDVAKIHATHEKAVSEIRREWNKQRSAVHDGIREKHEERRRIQSTLLARLIHLHSDVASHRRKLAKLDASILEFVEERRRLVRTVRVKRAHLYSRLSERIERARDDAVAHRATADDLHERLIARHHAFVRALPLHQRSWTDAEWSPFKEPIRPPRDASEAALRVGYRRFDVRGRKLELPSLVPFLGAAHLSIIDQTPKGEAAVELAVSILYRLFATMPPGDLRVFVFDRRDIGAGFRVFTTTVPDELFRVIHKVAELDALFDALLSDAKEQLQRLPPQYKSSFDVRDGSRKRATVIVLKDFDSRRLDHTTRDLIQAIQRQGHRVGLHLMMLSDQSAEGRVADMSEVRISSEDIAVAAGDAPVVWVSRDPKLSDAAGQRLLTSIAKAFASPRDVPLTLMDILPRPESAHRQQSSVRLRATIGYTAGTRPFHLDFDSRRDVHALLLGDTGTGKSSLLHIIISSLAMNYGPDEMRLVLLDDKEGTELSFYERLLPQLSLMELNRDTYFAYKILQDFSQRMDERQRMLRNANVFDLTEYRERYPEKTLPRELLIWDDIREALTHEDRLSDDVIALLAQIAGRGRSAGFHLLLAMPSLDQIEHRLKPVLRHIKQQLVLADPGRAARGNSFRAVASDDARSNIDVRLLRFDKSRERDDLRMRLSSALREGGHGEPAPKVLRSDRLAAIPTGLSRNVNGQPVMLLGERVDATNEPASIALARRYGANALFVGSEEVIGRLFDEQLRSHQTSTILNYGDGLDAAMFVERLENLESAGLIFIRDYVAFVSRLDGLERQRMEKALKKAPLDGAHVIAWSPSASGVTESSLWSGDIADVFAYRVVSTPDRAALTMIDRRLRDGVGTMRAWLCLPESDPIMFVPYDIPAHPEDQG